MIRTLLGFFCAGIVGWASAATLTFQYDADGRLLSTVEAGDFSNYTPTPVHNISAFLSMGDANTNGMPDSMEAYLAGHWSGVGDYDPFTADSDGDGMCDWNEWMLGTDPFSFDSIFSTWPSGGYGGGIPDAPIDFMVSWSSIPFRTYSVEFLPDLGTTNWAALATNVAATPPVNQWTHMQVTNVHGFYRVVTELPSTNLVEEGGAE